VSVYSLVTGIRRAVTVRVPAISLSGALLRAALVVSLLAYAAIKVYGVFSEVATNWLELVLLPGGVSGLLLALQATQPKAATVEDASSVSRERVAGLAGAVVLVAFTTTYVALNTVPVVTSPDESAIIHGGHEITQSGTLRITNELNDRYDTNIIGGLHVSYRSPTDFYHKTFPGTAMLYAPFSAMPDDYGFRIYTALFASIAVLALYTVSWRVLRSSAAGLIAAVAFAGSPAFGHWSVTVFNNIPVLAFELTALAVLLVPDDLKRRHLATAGILMAAAGFIRLTEFALVVPMLGLIVWRTRSIREALPFAGAIVCGVVAVLVANQVVSGDAFFYPQIGTPFLSSGAETSGGSSGGQSWFERYFLYVIGTQGSVSNFDFIDKIDNVLFHVRYLSSSIFAFPLLALGMTGVVWMVAARRRHALPVAIGVVTVAAYIILLYGQQEHNYFGYGQASTRSSFVRYSLPIYALLSIGVAAVFVEATRYLALRRTAVVPMCLFGTAIVGLIGIALSYDFDVYGFNRLNRARERDGLAWERFEEVLSQSEGPLLFAGVNSMKLIDGQDYPNVVNYSAVPSGRLWPLVTAALVDDRDTFLLTSKSQQESQHMALAFAYLYRMEAAVDSPAWTLWRIEQPVNERVCASCR
jgi:hypothetical protein